MSGKVTERNLRGLCVDGCPIVGEGFTSTIYALDQQRVAKVYKLGTPLHKAAEEYELTRAVNASGVPSVQAYELVRVGDCFGVVMERLSSQTLGATMHAQRENPDALDEYMSKYVALAKRLHATAAPSEAIPSVRAMWLEYVERLERWCTPSEVALVDDLVHAMPDGETFVHGDLHPGNIMLRGDELVLIDLPGLSRGTPLVDMAITYRGLVMGPKSPGIKKREQNMGMPATMISEVGDRFFRGYAGIDTKEELEELYGMIHPLYALSVVVMCGNGRLRDDKLAGLVMDELLRKVVVPQQDVIRQVWNGQQVNLPLGLRANSLGDFPAGRHELCVEGLTLVGEGGNSQVYALGDGRVVKVFNEGLPLDMVEYEDARGQEAYLAGVPCAKPYGMVRVQSRYGIVYDQLKGEDLLTRMAADKEHLRDYVRQFARQVRAMHGITVNTAALSDAKQVFLGFLSRLEGHLCTADEVERLRRVCEVIPDRATFVHGDCHPGNAMIHDGRLVFIDLASCGYGHPIFDVVGMCSIFLFASRDEERRQSLVPTRDFTSEECRIIWETFLRTYLATSDEGLLAKAERQVIGFAKVRNLLRTLIVADDDLHAYDATKREALAFVDTDLEPLCF